MKYSGKVIGLLFAAIIVSTMIGAILVPAEPSGEPFKDLWEAVTTLETIVEVHYIDISDLQSTIESLEIYIDQLEDQITNLEARVANLETDVPSHTHIDDDIMGGIDADTLGGYEPEDFAFAVHEHGFPAPDFDSGWMTIEPGTFYQQMHNLGTTELFIYIIGRLELDPLAGFEIHHIAYGSAWDHNQDGQLGIWWHCNEGAFSIRRFSDDVYWKEIRVMIWKLPEPPI